MLTRRHLMHTGLASSAALLITRMAQAQPGAASATAPPAEPPSRRHAGGKPYTPVQTLNGVSLPWVMKDGVKEFHLVAEEVDHTFAPGSRAKVWGYNGRTAGPTIEAIEGDRVRFLVTNKLPEVTSVHWHGIFLPSGMDGVTGLNQPGIGPGETWVYEFTLRQHGTFMYHPHADEMTQMALGMMGMLIVHPKEPEANPPDRDFAFMLHHYALHPGTWRPDPSIMLDFDLWTFNSKAYPDIEPLVVAAGDRVRIRMGNLSMWNHPIHVHGHAWQTIQTDGGTVPESARYPETTVLVPVGTTRVVEFIADAPGDWALHCHMAHHTMNAMGHGIPNNIGADLSTSGAAVGAAVPGYMPMGEAGMHDMQAMAAAMPGPENTLPMMTGDGPYGAIGMGGMFTVLKVREGLTSYTDPGWYDAPAGTVARKL